jgi:hypothetical protein
MISPAWNIGEINPNDGSSLILRIGGGAGGNIFALPVVKDISP